MNNLNQEADKIMAERFGRDMAMALVTTAGGRPYVRYVNAYYENGAFYIITHALSNKIKHIEDNSAATLASNWLTEQGKGIRFVLGRKGRKSCNGREIEERIFFLDRQRR